MPAPPIPPGFQLAPKKAPPLPPGFVLAEKNAAPPVPPDQVGLPVPTSATNPTPDPRYNVPGFGQPHEQVPVAPSNDILRSTETALQGQRAGLAALPGTLVDITNILAELGIRGADAILPGDWSGAHMSPRPIGGTAYNTDLLERLWPGPTYSKEEMTPLQRFGYEANSFGTQAFVPSALLRGVASMFPGKAVPFIEKYLQPYRQGATPVNDAVAGVGAGAGLQAYEEYAPDSVKDSWYGPLGSIVASLGGATGANFLQNLTKVAPLAARGIHRGVMEPDVPLGPEGQYYTHGDTDLATMMLRERASDPARAAEKIGQQANDLRATSPSGVPTSGALSDDPGLIMLEKGMRQDPKLAAKFVAADQATERAALGSVQKIEPEGKPRDFTDFVEGQHGARVSAAEKNVGGVQRQIDDLNAERARQAALLEAQRGGKVSASEALHESLVPAMTEAQQRKNDLFKAIDPDGTKMRSLEPLLAEIDAINARTVLPAQRPTDIEQALRTLAEQNDGQISFDQMNGLRTELASSIQSAQNAGNFGLADNLKALRAVLNREAEAMAALGDNSAIKALEGYRNWASTWNTGPGDAVTKFRKQANRDKFGGTTTPPSQTAGQFLQPGQPEKAASLKRALAEDTSGNGVKAVSDFMFADLAGANVVRNGAIDPVAVRNWMAKWGDEALNLSPGFRQQVDEILRLAEGGHADATVLSRQLKAASEDAIAAQKDTKAARRVLGKDPVNAVASIFASGDPERAAAEAVAQLGGDEAAKRGLRAAVRDFIIERLTTSGLPRTGTGENPLSFARLDELFKANEKALAHIYSPEDMNYLRAAHKFLAPLQNLNLRAVQGSQTSPNERLWEAIAKPLEVGLKFRLGILKGGGVMRTLTLWKQMLPDGDEAARELVARAYFDPELMKHLLTRDVSQINSAKYNRKLFWLLAYGAGARKMVESSDQQGATP